MVCGWNEGEFDMFGVQQRDHERRYEYAQEWLEALLMAWSPREEFNYAGQFLQLQGVRAKPKPYGGSRPLVMNAGASPQGRAFALRHCDAFFTSAARVSLAETAQQVQAIKAEATCYGRDIDVYTVGVVTCRPSQ